MKITINKTKIVETIYNEKRLTVIFGVLFVLSLLPILAIAFYNYPGVDDFGFGWKPRHAFIATHNLFAVIAAALETIGDYYYTWQGTFVSVFLFSLNPAVYNEALYPATTFFMLFVLISSTAFFLQTVFVKGLGLERKYVVLIGVPILFFSIQTPVLARHAFFWYNSATHYTLFYSLMLFLLGLCIRLYFANEDKAITRGGGGIRNRSGGRVVLFDKRGELHYRPDDGDYHGRNRRGLLCFPSLAADKGYFYRSVFAAAGWVLGQCPSPWPCCPADKV